MESGKWKRLLNRKGIIALIGVTVSILCLCIVVLLLTPESDQSPPISIASPESIPPAQKVAVIPVAENTKQTEIARESTTAPINDSEIIQSTPTATIIQLKPEEKQPTVSQEPTLLLKITEMKPSRCINATKKQLEAISIGIKGVSSKNEIRTGWAVKSNDYSNAWFVAAMIYGPGIENGTGPGLWIISGEPENPSSGAFSVDGFAKQFSDRGTGVSMGYYFSIYDDGAQEAMLCARNK